MISKEIFRKVRKLEIRTKGLVNNLFGGEYQSAFKGRGMAFSEVRPYQFGDDIRQIDWNVTARNEEPYVKIFEEEREQTLMLLVDISPSGFFGSKNQSKMDLATEISAVLAFSAIKNNDKVGLILFTDRIEKVVIPRKGRLHVLRLIRELYATRPSSAGTDIGMAVTYASKILNRRSIVVLASDFQAHGYEKVIKIMNRKHDLVGIRIDDPLENELPNLGIIPFLDAETGTISVVDTSSSRVRKAFKARRLQRRAELDDFFLKLHMDTVTVNTNQSYIEPLMKFFQRRINRY
ncbi:MAG: DUF58 domain-containing protein [Balneolaceae bacterium]|jgi:uncharacterized protein (DUF58 family)|nr:MAG: DUF58 domain-containing protein [Balneolaceae bacterium]